MLRIKRVPTVLSNYQKEEVEEGGAAGGCGRNCMRDCCLPGAKLPLYAFRKSDKVESSDKKEPPFAFLDSLLLGEWEDRVERGLFRYDVTACETKLNEGRHLKKRPTEFRVDKVLQPFDGSKFNFTKVGQEEILFQFESSEDDEVKFYPNAPIDVSPIEYGHVLLIPRILEGLTMRASCLHCTWHQKPGIHTFVSVTIVWAYYLAVSFPIEKAPTRKITDFNGGVTISEILKYPVRGLVFEGGCSLEDLSNAVSDSCICLQDNNIPYNVLISDSGKRIFLLPQCYAEKQALGEVSSELLDTQVNPAVWEISGHMVLKRKEDYNGASEENAWRLLAEVSLSEERFQEVIAIIFEAISCAVSENGSLPDEDEHDLEDVDALNNGSHQTAIVAGKQECLVQH
ncbi:hypothetical protein Ccrd_022614 [Cynara cardunculus var. scolymus]|uniref:GDP-L-galactose phosphorylase 1 n=1 Tax=Cynara cardunculus var. scolymus TaxID=59895 RepID=A0A103XYA1_CYNCS|nr:hypothetical protein Ccrd_022614 [Cynara cardunculus var. scolymus]